MKYDTAHIDPLLEALKDGQGRVRACMFANITYQTFLNWLGEDLEFLESVKKAESDGNDKIKDMQKRKIIEDPSWQSGAWWLERNFPDEFRNRQDLNLSTTKKTISELFPTEEELNEQAGN